MAASTEDGTLALIPGARAFARELAPSYIDHACMINGYVPPPGSPLGEGVDAGFSYCELDCGSATTETLLAGSNPLGNFTAIDARSDLMARGRALAKDGNVRNIAFHEARLEESLDLDLPPFDYIVVEGIYSWVPLRERAFVLAFVRKFLRPGGAVVVSYNARPGWNRLDLFRRLFREATRGVQAEPRQRLALCRDLYAKLIEAKAPAVLAAGLSAASFAELANIPEDAFAADYLNDFAEPLYVSEVAADFAAVDCVLAGTADMAQSLQSVLPHEPFKSVLERLPTGSGRELAKDMLLDTRFRRDVFIRGGRRLAADNHDMVMNGLAFALEQPAELVRYEGRAPFGKIRFDNPHARKLVGLLTQGPRTLGELVAQSAGKDAEFQTVVANVHALIVTGQLRPVYRATRDAADGARALQSAIRTRAVTDEAVGFLPSPFGTAFAVPLVDQVLMDIPGHRSADVMAQETLARFVNSGRAFSERGELLKRARSFRRNLQYYATLGLAPV
jgi:SAM-dependent methyltransferase